MILGRYIRQLPQPTISWVYQSNFGDPEPVTNLPNAQLQNSNMQLVITSVEISNAGYYFCTATNSVGSEATELVITVADNREFVAYVYVIYKLLVGIFIQTANTEHVISSPEFHKHQLYPLTHSTFFFAKKC